MKRSIGIIVLGVGGEPEKMSKKLAKRLADHPNIGLDRSREHQLRCGGPAEFQGLERDIVLAVLPSKVLLNNISEERWNQAVNVAVSRAKERFHLFHQLSRADIKSSEQDPRRKLIEYCEAAARAHGAGGDRQRLDGLQGFARQVLDDLAAASVEVRGCDEILPPEWRDRMLVVEGARRMVAVVLNGGESQTADLWQVGSEKWAVLSRVDWRVVEVWRFQRAVDRDGFVRRLLRVLFDEEGVRRLERACPPEFRYGSLGPFVGEVEVLIDAPSEATVMYSMDGSEPATEYVAGTPVICRPGSTTIRAYAVQRGFIRSEERSQTFVVLERVQRPEILPASEGPFADSVRVSFLCPTAGAEVWYTTDGSPPTGDTRRVYGEEELLLRCGAEGQTFRVRAIGALPGVMAESEEAARLFQVLPATSVPRILDPVYERADRAVVRIECSSAEAIIRFTTEHPAQLPSSLWQVYDASTGVRLRRNGVIITAVAQAGRGAESPAVSSQPVALRACRPTFQPDGGALLEADGVVLSCDTARVQLRFRIEAPQLVTDWAEYTGPIALRTTGAVIRAVASRDGLGDSEEAISGRFTLQARRPKIECAGGFAEDCSVSAVTSTALYDRDRAAASESRDEAVLGASAAGGYRLQKLGGCFSPTDRQGRNFSPEPDLRDSSPFSDAHMTDADVRSGARTRSRKRPRSPRADSPPSPRLCSELQTRPRDLARGSGRSTEVPDPAAGARDTTHRGPQGGAAGARPPARQLEMESESAEDGRGLDPLEAVVLRCLPRDREPGMEPSEARLPAGREGEVKIGRSTSMCIRVHEPAPISRSHCVVRRSEDGAVVLENKSEKMAIFLVGARDGVEEVQPRRAASRALRHGDIIALQRRGDSSLGHCIKVLQVCTL